MNISAVDLASKALTDCFDQSSAVSKMAVLPEKKGVESLAQQQQHFTTLLASAQNISPRLIDPQTMLAIQHGMMQLTLTVDLVAKMTGSLTQAVNRLVTIQ